MPFVNADGKWLLYCHIPKCAGSSVETYLTDRFGPLAFLDQKHTRRVSNKVWSKTSPQHIVWDDLAQLFPDEFFDAAFAIVRNPVARIVSSYKFQRDVERLISDDVSFSDWLAELPAVLAENPYQFDNHLRPQVDFMPPECAVFHLEHGLESVVAYLDSVAGNEKGPRAIGKENTSHRNAKAGIASEPIVPSANDLEIIESLYRRDFEQLGYRIDEPKPVASRPAGSAASQSKPANNGARNLATSALSVIERGARRLRVSMS